MKIAHIITELKPSGPANVVKNIVDNLPTDTENKLFYFRGPPTLEINCDTEVIDFKNVDKLKKYDIIHSHGLRPDVINAYLSIKSHKHKHVSTLHNYVKEELLNIYGQRAATIVTPLWFIAWRRMNALAVLSQDAKKYYKSKLKSKQLEVIPNGIDLSKNRQGVAAQDIELITCLKSKYYILGSNAHIIKRKGLDAVIEALVDLPECAFIAVGEGPHRKALEELAHKKNVADRCLFLGYKSNATEFLAYYDVYMMPSTSEGFGLALIEAMAYGVPCVCSNIAVFKEILSNNEGAFFDLNDRRSLVVAIRQAIKNNTTFSNQSKDKYHREYTGLAMSNKYLNLYRNLLHSLKDAR